MRSKDSVSHSFYSHTSPWHHRDGTEAPPSCCSELLFVRVSVVTPPVVQNDITWKHRPSEQLMSLTQRWCHRNQFLKRPISDQSVMQPRVFQCYFFTIEFGLCKQDGQLRAYGAGLLSSIGELRVTHTMHTCARTHRRTHARAHTRTVEVMFVCWCFSQHALSEKACVKMFDPKTTCNQECLITTFQEVYFVSESFEEAKEKMR